MNKITTGLAAASLTALALGAASPAVAAPSPMVSNETAVSTGSTTAATTTPHIAFIKANGPDQLSVGGLAPGATLVGIDVEGASTGGVPVQNDRFATLIDMAHLGKKATLTAYTPQGRITVDFVLELGYAEGEDEAPGKPVIHAVSKYDDDHFVIEGTVTHDPQLFSKTEVWADIRGVSWDFPAENGSFSLTVPASYAGQTVDVKASYRGHFSEITPVEMVETETNTASETFPLEVASPATGEVVTAPEATFTGSAIPNSQIVVTRDSETNTTSATLCETRVTSTGDWSCTSPTLPAGDYETTVTETPTWASAAAQTQGTAFTVADATAVDDRWTPTLPVVSSITERPDGELVVRLISHHAASVDMSIDEDRVVTRRGMHGRFTFTIDAADAGKSVTFTGLAGRTQGPALDATLTPVEAEGTLSPLAAPRIHAIREDSVGNLHVLGTTSYFQDEFDVPQVIVQKDGVYIGGSQATWNGAYAFPLGSEFAGEKLDVLTVRNGQVSEATTITLAPTAANDAPDQFPFDVTSPAPDEVIPVTTRTFTGQGIPGSTIAVNTTTSDAARASIPEAYTTVLGDGTWTLELDATRSLTPGEHTMTVVETPYWGSLAPMTSTRSFTVADDSDEGTQLPLAVTTPAPGSTVIAPDNTVTFTGTGTIGADISLVNGIGRTIAFAEVGDDGTWTTSGLLGHQYYQLDVVQIADGTRTATTTSLTVRATAGVEQPFSIDTPAHGSTVVAPDNTVTFTGRGTTGEGITLTAGNGREVARATVGDDGTWTGKGVLGHQYYDLATQVTHLDSTVTNGVLGLTVTAVDSRPFALTTPADGATVAAADNMVTFTGTGTPNATVVLTAGNGRVVIDTTVRPDGTFIARGFLGHQLYELATSYTAPGEQPMTGTTTVTVTR